MHLFVRSRRSGEPPPSAAPEALEPPPPSPSPAKVRPRVSRFSKAVAFNVSRITDPSDQDDSRASKSSKRAGPLFLRARANTAGAAVVAQSSSTNSSTEDTAVPGRQRAHTTATGTMESSYRRVVRTSFFRPLSFFRTSIGGRLSFQWGEPGDGENEQHVFDSPLAESISILDRLRERFKQVHRLRGEAQAITYVMGLLHAPNLHDARPMAQLIENGKLQADEETENWLTAMEWMKKKEEGSGRSSTGRTSRKSLLQSRDSHLDVHLQSMDEENCFLNPLVRPKLAEGSEARVLEMLEHEMTSWEFDLFELAELTGGHPIAALGWAIFERHGLRHECNVRPEVLTRCFERIEEGYLPVAYHNSTHGACVTHSVYVLLTQLPELESLFNDPVDLFAAVFAGLVHDIGHPGQNNAFHVATGSDLALLYSDQSVLEMHHLATAFQLLRDPECNVMGGLDAEMRREVRSRTVGMILATDLVHNFPTINAFKQMISEKSSALQPTPGAAEDADAATPAGAPPVGAGATASPTRASQGSAGSGTMRPVLSTPRRRGSIRFQSQLKQWLAADLQLTQAELLLILKMLLKVSDISNVTKGRAYCLRWTKHVVDEFFAQGDLEAELQLPVTPFMDRATACIPKQQLGFYNFIVRPMYEAMDGLVSMEHPLKNLEDMYEYWQEQLPEDETAPQTSRRENGRPGRRSRRELSPETAAVAPATAPPVRRLSLLSSSVKRLSRRDSKSDGSYRSRFSERSQSVSEPTSAGSARSRGSRSTSQQLFGSLALNPLGRNSAGRRDSLTPAAAVPSAAAAPSAVAAAVALTSANSSEATTADANEHT